MRILLLMLSNFFFLASQCQTLHISGSVMQPDNTILPYVNIGIKQKNIGTVSDLKGMFDLAIPSSHQNDTLTFSYIGCKELNIPIGQILKTGEKNFILIPEETILEEVIISNKKPIIKKLGIKSSTPLLSSPPIAYKSKDINEFAQYININNKPSRILDANIKILTRASDSTIVRINFYDIDNGFPGRKIFPKNIIRNVPVENGWLTIDLKDYNIVFDKNFFIGFEFMPIQSKYTFMYGARLGGEVIARESSLGVWKKEKGGSVSAYVTVKQ